MLLLNLILFLVILGVLWWLITLIPLPHPLPVIIQVLFVILAVLCIVSVFLGHPLLGVSVPRGLL